MTGADTSSSQSHLLAILPVDRQGGWLDACLLCGGGRDLSITQVPSVRDAVSASRQQEFDLLLLWQESTTHQALSDWQQSDGLVSASGFVALGMHVCEGWHAPLFSAGALACCDMDHTDPLTLVHTLRSAIELAALRRERRQWQHQINRLHQREARELDRLLSAQKALLARLDHLGQDQPLAEMPGPHQRSIGSSELETASRVVDEETLAKSYRLALQSFLFDETQPSSWAVAHMAEACRACGMTGAALMRLHLESVETLTQGAGAGGLRHYLTGADRFIIEILLRIVDRSGSASELTSHNSKRTSPLAAA